MDNQADKSASAARPHCFVAEAIPAPSGQARRVKTMARLEREAASRKWLLIAGALLTVLILGVLIGRFLLP
jgi:hypothetical protein